ncbi:MAG: hypothetical protein ABL897_04920, partial [Hyphomicrobium sp.]
SNSFGIDDDGRYINNTAYFLPTTELWLPSVLNSPLTWWYSWRKAQHGKDEALRFMDAYIRPFPLAAPLTTDSSQLDGITTELLSARSIIRENDSSLADWLGQFWDFRSLPTALRQASLLDSDGFIAAVRAALPRRQSLTPTQLRQLRDAFADTAEPARAARRELLAHERALAAMVERAYGLTSEEVALMWRTAPPRMPLPPPIG